MIVDCISDLHGFYPQLEGGDLLIVAGDLTATDQPEEYLKFNEWIKDQKYKYKILVSGEHDNCLQFLEIPFIPIYGINVKYLCDSGTEFGNLKIWGSPWTLRSEGMNPNCRAFTCETEEELAEKWELIPEDLDILVTHGPPYGVLDSVFPRGVGFYQCTGSSSLAIRMEEMRKPPRFHIFGHIHEGYGQVLLKHLGPNTLCVNCSHVNKYYKPVNKPARLTL